jgi:hypothetical protein
MLAMRRPLQEVYQDLYGHPIDDASRLMFSADVPADVAQEEPSSVPALSRRVPTPTQLSPAGLSPSRARARGVAIGGAAAVGLLVGTLLVFAGWHTEGRAQATSSPQPMSDPRPMPAPSIVPQPFPEQRFQEIVSEPPPSPPVIAPPIVSVSQASAPKRPALSATPSRVLNARAPMAEASADPTSADPTRGAGPPIADRRRPQHRDPCRQRAQCASAPRGNAERAGGMFAALRRRRDDRQEALEAGVPLTRETATRGATTPKTFRSRSFPLSRRAPGSPPRCRNHRSGG